MANKILLRRGLKSKLPTLSAGEPAYTTDSREFFMGTGSGNVNMGGSQWYTGTAMSGTSTSSTYSYTSCPLVKVGDIYLNTSYGYINVLPPEVEAVLNGSIKAQSEVLKVHREQLQVISRVTDIQAWRT